MNLYVICALYGVLLYVVLGGFMLTVCTDYPERLRTHRNTLLRTQRRSYVTATAFVLMWYILGLICWPAMLQRPRH